MDLMTILGWIVGIGAIGWVLAEGGTIQFFINTRAMVLVFGGTLGATLITYPWTTLRRVPYSMLLFVFPGRRESADSMMSRLLTLSNRARRSSMESLEMDMRGTKDYFLANGLKMIADGLPANLVRSNLEKEI